VLKLKFYTKVAIRLTQVRQYVVAGWWKNLSYYKLRPSMDSAMQVCQLLIQASRTPAT
jgi:hypothetical protein